MRTPRQILEESQTIAVVGASRHGDKAAYAVPLQLKLHGWRLIPVNPYAQRIWDEVCYPTLAAIPGRRRIHLYTDSAYVMNCFRDRWYEKWEKNGWIGAGKKPVTNRDLCERLIRETRRHEVVWNKVRGHSGDVMNERVDALARAAIATLAPGG